MLRKPHKYASSVLNTHIDKHFMIINKIKLNHIDNPNNFPSMFKGLMKLRFSLTKLVSLYNQLVGE